MTKPDKSGDQIRIQRVSRMLSEEFRIRRKQARIQGLQHTWNIDLRIFGIRVVAVDQHCQCRQRKQTGYPFHRQKMFLLWLAVRSHSKIREIRRIPAAGRRGQFTVSTPRMLSVATMLLTDTFIRGDSQAGCQYQTVTGARFPISPPALGRSDM